MKQSNGIFIVANIYIALGFVSEIPSNRLALFASGVVWCVFGLLSAIKEVKLNDESR